MHNHQQSMPTGMPDHDKPFLAGGVERIANGDGQYILKYGACFIE